MRVVQFLLLLLCANVALDGCTGCGKNPNITNKLKAEGEKCTDDDQCESSVCDAPPGEDKVCLRTCNEGCEATDVCTPLADGDRYVCLPEKEGLCQTCQLDEDCPYPGDRCLVIGGTRMCGRDCSNPQDGVQQCPTSYRCADGTGANGALVTKQCQPISGTCECTSASVGQTKPCEESNSFGTCMGQQTCQPPNGYTACSAPIPGAESCNGKDDDCNGQIDEGLGETSCGIGACRRTSSNCINGMPATCMPGAPTVELCDGIDSNCDGIVDTDIAQTEICDGLDNDCDGLTDEDFNLATDVTHCGSCAINCGNASWPGVANYACVAGVCGIGTCSSGFENCDLNPATGCETDIDNGTVINGTLTNCGACNRTCTVVHGTATCVAGTCNVGVCDNDGVHNWQDCYPDSVDGGAGCETDVNVTVTDCGTCGHACPSRPFSTPLCAAGGCSYTCMPTFFDVDGLPNNGCEYQCTVTNGGVDLPDDSFLDQNCDGIDGDLSKAIFVSLGGNDLNDGLTRTTPKRTIQAGINVANSTRAQVYVAAGTYNEAVSLRSGISVYGGFNPATWKRNDASGLFTIVNNNTTSSNRIVTIAGEDIVTPTTLAYLTVTTGPGGTVGGIGTTTYGIHCFNCSALTLSRMTVTAGAGGAGGNGSSGSTGASGNGGTNGSDGANDSNSGGAGGPGGASPSCTTDPRSRGGNGGNGSHGYSTGNAGGGGYNSAGTLIGNGGGGGGRQSCEGLRGDDGTDGTAGGTGSNGSAGSGFVHDGRYLTINSGGTGGTGASGIGGGGGGGGGGQGESGCCRICDDGKGSGGGGGGSGGCGGTGGTGGRGGGASIGVLLANSSGAQVLNSIISSGVGGRGGNGGSGGGGGGGGGKGYGSTYTSGEVGAGGNGGNGGPGGTGGRGGGGAGGPSYGIYRINSTITASGNTLTAGGGGQGGTGPNDGVTGASAGSN